ncbi:MAG: serine/threonine-protein kinase [Pseudomonadota bacterium]
MMSADRDTERAALTLLEEAFGEPSPERAQWIEAQSSFSAAVRERALALLTISLSGRNHLGTGGAATLVQEEKAPVRIGPYKIGALLGRGGMGAVYVGERDSGDFNHRTAIKIIRPGVLSEALVERFSRERQLLAQLKHPHIAQLYDGGETDDGTPYFVMEYVNGRPIPYWLEAAPRSLDQRLGLFLQICDAVEFAHQNLIIHRDLTPSNVLVTTEGNAKLIDFGIAKPPSAGTAATAGNSSLSPLSLTPGFAAPERASTNEASTLTDIYSLGKILATLTKDISNPELDAIAAKASNDLPEERYATARALSRDVERFQGGYAISAFSSSTGYRLGKLFKRQSLALSAGGLALVALIAGLITTSFAYQRADIERAKAAARFEDVRALAKFQLFDLYDSLSRVAGNTQARATLANEAQGYLKTLANDPEAPADVQLDTAAGYVRLARIIGVPPRPSLGQVELAKSHLQQAERLLEQYQASGHALVEQFHATKADLYASRAMVEIHEEMTMDKADASLAAANAALKMVPAQQRSQAWFNAKRQTLYSEADHADLSSNRARILSAAQRLRDNADSWPRRVLPERKAALDKAMAQYLEALADYVVGDHAVATPKFIAANKDFEALGNTQPNDPILLYLQTWTNYIGYGSAAQVPGLIAQEEVFLSRAQALVDRLKGLEERDASVVALGNRLKEARAQYLAKTGDFAKAITVQNTVLDFYQAQLDSSGEEGYVFDVAYTKITLAFLLRDVGDLQGACSALIDSNALLAPIHARQSLPSFMARAGDEVPKRIALCKKGEDIGRQNTVFEKEGWADPKPDGSLGKLESASLPQQ